MINSNNINCIEKIASKNELHEELQKYKYVINSWMIDYLNSLLRLEFSVVREIVNKNEREVLSELEIYKKIAMYNIYHRAQNLIKKTGMDFEILDNEQNFQGLIAEMSLLAGKNIISFDYNYSLKYSIDDVSSNYIKSMYIGEINLCHLGVDDNYYENLNKELDLCMVNVVNDPMEKKLKNVVSNIKAENEMINKLYDWFLKDYGLTEDYFEKNKKLNSSHEKKLVNNIPNLIINSSIKRI